MSLASDFEDVGEIPIPLILMDKSPIRARSNLISIYKQDFRAPQMKGDNSELTAS